MEVDITNRLRGLPSVDRVLQTERCAGLLQRHDHRLVVEAVRQALDAAREEIRADGSMPAEESLLDRVEAALARALKPTLQPVINATGVIIHTNLGRAPLSRAARAAMTAVGAGYSNLEYDLERGERGSRYSHAEELLCRLTGAEAALVVNNNAGAVLLALSALARGKEVIISRSQLIEIGGGFRIPEVMAQSGARLVEVGTTNRTRMADFEGALSESTGLLMRAHHSNFRIIGFTEEPALGELVALGRRSGVPVLDDLGSGTLLDTAPFGLEHEPTVQESLEAGAALVTFSGDKLLGATQAGILVGEKALVERLRRFPLTRALRVDKVTLAGLQATLLHYVQNEAVREVPVWQMIALESETVRETADRWAAELSRRGLPATVVAALSTIGGGALPGATLPTWHVALAVPSPDRMARRLRAHRPPVIAIIQNDSLRVDPRTVQADEAEILLAALAWAYDE